MEEHLVVLVTAPSRAVGRDVARALLEQQLAACVNVIPSIDSLYTWEGEIRSDEEVLLMVKTTAAAFDALATVVRDVHPYEVPEIIALPIVAGTRDYLDWIDEVVED
ncbi:MAG: divalent-cation tolerance protein CutA [Anaerolineae bacterium]